MPPFFWGGGGQKILIYIQFLRIPVLDVVDFIPRLNQNIRGVPGWLAQLVECATLGFGVVSSSPKLGEEIT